MSTATTTREERLRALSKQARLEHAQKQREKRLSFNQNTTNENPTSSSSSTSSSTTSSTTTTFKISYTEDEHSELRKQVKEAEAEAENAIQAAKDAETVKSAALHELEKYQLAYEQLQIKVAELEGKGNENNNAAPGAVPPPAQPPSAPPSSIPLTPRAASVILCKETIEKTPTLFLAGKRRRHGQSMYEMGSKTHVSSDELNSASYKHHVTNASRPRFSNSSNYHDPRDPNHDYSQSVSPSRMVILDQKHSKVSPQRNQPAVKPQKILQIKNQIQNMNGSGVSLYNAALSLSPHKEILPSHRDSMNKLSHTGKKTIESMPEDDKPHLLNFHRRADDVIGDRHSYHHHHHNLDASGFFQSVKNSKLGTIEQRQKYIFLLTNLIFFLFFLISGMKAHGLKHVEHARRHNSNRQMNETAKQLKDGTASNADSKTSVNSRKKKKRNELLVMEVSPRSKNTNISSVGKKKKKKVQMIFGRRKNSTFLR
jgi:hypothetical protein